MAERLSEELQLSHLAEWTRRLEDSANLNEQDMRLVEDTFAAAERVVARMNGIYEKTEPTRTGCVMAVGRRGETDPFLVARKLGVVEAVSTEPEHVGTLEQQKLGKYAVYAVGKTFVITMNPGSASSRENMSLGTDVQLTAEGKTIPAGAILFDNDLVLSTSGYQMVDDECVVLATAVGAGWITREGSLELAQRISGETFLRYQDIHGVLLGEG